MYYLLGLRTQPAINTKWTCGASHYYDVWCHFAEHITHLLTMSFADGAIQYAL